VRLKEKRKKNVMPQFTSHRVDYDGGAQKLRISDGADPASHASRKPLVKDGSSWPIKPR
jgi:hypothetical protein